MPRNDFHIFTEGMQQMENDFSPRSVDAGIEAGHERLRAVADIGEEILCSSIPVGTDPNDPRRPRGALRDSARHTVVSEGDDLTVVYEVGTNDDAVPYAKWVLYKNIRKPDGDYLEPMDEYLDTAGPRAMDSAFDAMFGED